MHSEYVTEKCHSSHILLMLAMIHFQNLQAFHILAEKERRQEKSFARLSK